MSEIDVERLKVDANYWDEKAGTASHYCPANNQFYDCRLHPCCIPRPAKTEWVDGLPPVGCECEFRYVSGQWGRAKVDYIGRQVIVFTDDNGAERTEYRHNSENFRPIQTPGQRMREATVNRVCDMAAEKSLPTIQAVAEMLYDAGMLRFPGNNLTEK